MQTNKLQFVYIVLSSILLLSNVNNPPNGSTGAPGDGVCSNCHSGSSGGLDGSVTISGLPSSIMVNTTYTITVTVENLTTASKGGFQLVTLDQNNNNSGTLSGAGPSSTIQSSGGRTYFEHNPSLSFGGPGTVSYTINWLSPPAAAGQTITMYAASILSNGNGNSSNDLMKLDQTSGTMPGPPPLSGSITSFSNLMCNAGFDGSITVTASNGVPPYSYSWSDGQTTATAIGLSAKMYSVTVGDNIGAMVVLTKLLTEPPAINIVSTGKKILSCNGDRDGSFNINSSGGTGMHTYKWNTGATTKIISNLSSGEYTVTVTDANNCTQSSMLSITQPELMVITIRNQENPTCLMDATGNCNAIVDGGTVNYKYKWTSGETTNGIVNKKVGTYTVTVTDANNCTKTKSVTFTVLDSIKPVFKHWKDTVTYRCNLIAVSPNVTDNCTIKEVILLEGIQIGDTFPVGLTKMRYKAMDDNSNVSEYTYTVKVINPLKLQVDTFTYDTCKGNINFMQIKLSNESNFPFYLFFNANKINRFDTAIQLKLNQFNFVDTSISVMDSFQCSVDTVLLFNTAKAKFKLDSFFIKDASFCNLSDGEIDLKISGNIVSSKWIDDAGNEISNQSGKKLSAGRYYFVVSSGTKEDTLACNSTFGPFDVKCTTSSNTINEFAFILYPNPANDELNIRWNKEIFNYLISIYSVNGWKIQTIENYSEVQKIDLSNLVNGIYILQIEINGFKQRAKFIIAR